MDGRISRRALLAAGLLASSGIKGSATEFATPANALAAADSAWPLRLARDRGHLVNRRGDPVLLVGDTAWSLMAVPDRTGVLRYLRSRANLGVNVIIANLVESTFSPHEPPSRNFNGDLPFQDNDFSMPSRSYFQQAAWVLDQAMARGIGVLLAPAYIGFQCGEQGWCPVMRRNGPSALADYGRFLGRKFGAYPNVIWLHGGDHTPDDSDLRLVAAVRKGIVAGGGGGQLHTYHWKMPPAEDPRLNRVDIDTIYSYDTGALGSHGLAAQARDRGKRPFIFLEGTYENEYGSRPVQWREQFYTTILAGGAGFVFGNYPIWPFWSRGDRRYGFGDDGFPRGWKTALASPGAANLKRAGQFFRSLPWHALAPDTRGALLADSDLPLGRGIMAAVTGDRRLGLVYFGRIGTASLQPKALNGAVSARWFDPATGDYTKARRWTPGSANLVTFRPPAVRADGSSDWLLVLRAAG